MNPGSSVSVSFPILSPGVKSFLVARSNQLPPVPFNLVASCNAVALSQAGDVFESNSLALQILLRDDVVATTAAATIPETAPATVLGEAEATLSETSTSDITTIDVGTIVDAPASGSDIGSSAL